MTKSIFSVFSVFSVFAIFVIFAIFFSSSSPLSAQQSFSATASVPSPQFLALAATNTVQGIAGTGTAVTYTISGTTVINGNPTSSILAQGQLPTSAGALYTVAGSTTAYISVISLSNTTSSIVSGVALFVNGAAAANSLAGTFSIPANGTAVYTAGIGLKIQDANGNLGTGYPLTLPNGTTASTQTAADNSTKLATDAYVDNEVGLAGATAISTSGGSTTLSAAQYGSKIILVTGTLTSNATLTMPNNGDWNVANRTTGAFTVTIKTNAGTGMTVTQGYTSHLISNGTNVVDADDDYNGHGAFTNSIASALDSFYAALRQSSTKIVRIINFGDSILTCYQISPCNFGPQLQANSPLIALRNELLKQYVQYSTGLRIPFKAVNSSTVDGGEGGYTATSGTPAQSTVWGPQEAGTVNNGAALLTEPANGNVLTIAVGQPYRAINVYCVETATSTGWTVTIGGTAVGTACGTTSGTTLGVMQTFSNSAVTTATASSWSITSTTLTVTTLASGTFAVGGVLSGTSVTGGTTILQQLTGTVGGAGTYQLSAASTASSGTLTQTGGLVNSTLTLTTLGTSSFLGGYEAITTIGTAGVVVDNIGEAGISSPFFAGASGQGWVNLLPGTIALGVLETGINDAQAGSGPLSPAAVMTNLQVIATNIQAHGGSVLMWIPSPFQNSGTPAPYTAIQTEEWVYSQAQGWDLLVMNDLFYGAGVTSGQPNFASQNTAAVNALNYTYGYLTSDNLHPTDLGSRNLFIQLYQHLFGRLPVPIYGFGGTSNLLPNKVMLSGNYTNATTSFTPVTETAASLHPLQFQIGPSQYWGMRCHLAYSVSAVTDGIILEVTGSNTTLVTTQMLDWGTSATTSSHAALSNTGWAVQIPTAGVATSTITTIFTAEYVVGVVNNTQTFVVALNAKGVGAGTLTIFAGSYCVQE